VIDDKKMTLSRAQLPQAVGASQVGEGQKNVQPQAQQELDQDNAAQGVRLIGVRFDGS
jgi:hypothetical protein